MLMRNFIFRSSSHLTMRQSPHFILWRHLAARHYQKFRNRLFNQNNSTCSCYQQQHQHPPSPSQSKRQQQNLNEDCNSSITTNGNVEHISIEIEKSTTTNEPSTCMISNGKTLSVASHQQIESATPSTSPHANVHHIHNNNNHSLGATTLAVQSTSTVVCRVASVAVGIGLVIAFVTLLWYYMGWLFGLPALLVALVAIVVTKVGWRWFYIAGATVKRDIMWVNNIFLIFFRKYIRLVKKFLFPNTKLILNQKWQSSMGIFNELATNQLI